jgi:hypothetical protein
MSAASVLLALGPWLGAVVLVLLLLAELTGTLIGRQHPLRILNHALTSGFYLLLAGILVQLGGGVAVIWWLLAVLAIAAVILALVRSRIAAPGAIARAQQDLPPRDSPEASVARREHRRARRRVRRASRPAIVEIAGTAILFLAAVALALVAG